MGSLNGDNTARGTAHTLLLLRHGEVASHKGDVPVTSAGVDFATNVGRDLAAQHRAIRLLTGETLRTRQTAEAIARGAESGGAVVTKPAVAHALRNPDIYVAGVRVNMVSTAEALAEQIDGFTAAQVNDVPFFAGFLGVADRIRYWLDDTNPPGEDGAAVANRIESFASSLVDNPVSDNITVAVTHSPVLRACMRHCLDIDPGEPDWVTGLSIGVAGDRSLSSALWPDAPNAAFGDRAPRSASAK